MTSSLTKRLLTSSGSVQEAPYTEQSSSPEQGGGLCFTGHLESDNGRTEIDRLWVTGTAIRTRSELAPRNNTTL